MANKLPDTFWERLKLIYSPEDIKTIEKWLNLETRKTSFRINTIKSDEEEIAHVLKEYSLDMKKVDFLENCYTLENGIEKDLWDLDIFKQWKIYLQQIASQIPVPFMDIRDGNTILDCTAAPGSKTSQMASLMKNTWKIIAVDNNQIRIDKLNFTLKRQGSKNVEVIKTDARKLSEPLWELLKKEWGKTTDSNEYFDNILLDAPCSAEWRMNLNKEKTYWFWADNIFKRNYRLSKSILEEVIPMLKKWGTLMFSTCTLAPEENEAIVHFVLSNYPEISIEEISLENKNIRPWIKSFGKQIFRNDVIKSIRCLPSEETEWFFIAKFKKNI